MNEVISGIHRWETKGSVLRSRYDEDLKETLKLAISIGMMPKEYQDLIWQQGVGKKDLEYEASRD